jgi:predicted nucleic acid-binding protein
MRRNAVMIYLLDVNALVALGFINHEFHDRIAAWVQSHSVNRASLHLATCSITELAFLRVLAQAPTYGFTVAHARTLLSRLKQARNSLLTFIPDGHDVSHLPAWVRAPKQITDGHLSKLASENGAILATLDENIPGSYLIPK